jgi:hypothetical protein
MFLFTALAVVLACGVCVQQGLAQEDDYQVGTGQLGVASVGALTLGPDLTGAGLFQGIVAMGPNPPSSGDWPCFAGGSGAGCAAIPAGGLVVGVPVQVWDLSSANGQIYYTFQTTTAHGKGHTTVTVKQGTTTILNVSGSLGTILADKLHAVWVNGATFTGAIAGPATITVTTKVGTEKITGKATIHLQ